MYDLGRVIAVLLFGFMPAFGRFAGASDAADLYRAYCP